MKIAVTEIEYVCLVKVGHNVTCVDVVEKNRNVSEKISNSIEKDCVIVVKSTVQIGTNDKIYFKRLFSIKDIIYK